MQRRTRKSIYTVAAATVLSLCMVTGSRADYIAINAPVEAGNQAFGSGLGIDFTVTSPIEITALGVFDDNADGIAQSGGADTTLTTVLYGGVDPSDRTAGTILASQDFTTSAPGTLAANSSFRFINLATPITLQPGLYDIAGYGFNDTNLEDNTGAGQVTQSGGASVTYNASYYSLLGPGAPPEGFDSTVIKYAAGSFQFVALAPLTRTWTGASSPNWSDAGNWVEGALTNNNPLTFSTVANQPMNDDVSGYSAAGLTFTSGGFTLSGDDLTNTDRLVSQAGANTINLNLTLTGTGTQIEVDAGTLTVNGKISAPLPAAGYQFVTKSGDGTLILNGVNDFQSGMIVNAGTVQLQDVSDNGGTSSLGVPEQDGTAVSGLLAIYNGTVIVTGSGTQTTERSLYTDQSGATKALDIQNAGTTIVSTGEWRSNGALANALTLTGPGTLSLEGDDPFFATQTGDRAYNFIDVQAGTLQLGRSVGSAVDGITDIAPGATVQITGNDGTQIFVDTAGAYSDPGMAATVGGVQMSGGTFDLDGNNTTINRLSSSVATSKVTNSATGTLSTLTIGLQNLNAIDGSGNYAGIDATYAGSIEDGAGKVAITKVGPQSTVTLSGANTYTGATTVSEGTLVLGSPLTKSSTVAIAAGGTLRLAPGGANVLVTPSLTIASGGTLDITNNKATVNFEAGGNPDPISDIVAALKSASDNGKWDGPGITSSSIASNPGTGIGYADGNTDTGGAAAPGTILIEYTWLGDLDLSGQVDSTDFNTISADRGMTGADWAQGDLNYDGVVNGDDFALFALGKAEYAASAGGTVPEPGSLVAGLVLLGLGARRRIRRKVG